MKSLSSMTLAEAEAYRQGYADGLQARYGFSLKEPTGLGFPQCRSADPSQMCAKCNCWKMTRELCS